MGFKLFYFYLCVNICEDAHKGHERVLHPLVLEFEVIKSHLRWVLELILGSLQEQRVLS